MKKTLTILALALALILTFTGCSPTESPPATEGSPATSPERLPREDEDGAPSEAPESPPQGTVAGITTGAWSEDGLTFTNAWSDIKFTLPADWIASTPEEMEAQLAVSEDILVNGGNKTAFDLAKLKTAYDFIIGGAVGLPNAILSYENLALSLGSSQMSAEDYYDVVAKQLLAVEGMGYAEVGTTTTTLAGSDCFVATMSVMDGALYQDYYLRKIDKVIMVLILTYTDETAAEAEAFVSSIKTAK
jgi:hypothetical protein